jgi:diguanylate cyclase (GGDEF)-like protein
MSFVSPDEGIFLSTMPAGRSQRRLALAVVLIATVLFAASAPFAKVQLQRVDAFIPSYETAVVIFDLMTAVLLFGQFAWLRSRAILILACGYLFTSTITFVHALSFPGLFAPQGLLGAGPQTTVWLYVFWHVGFALFVLAYALLNDEKGGFHAQRGGASRSIFLSICAVLVLTGLLTLLSTAGQVLLPPIMDGDRYGPGSHLVAMGGWVFALLALAALLRRGPRSVLDLWIMVVMCVQVLEVALSATINGGRFDVGFYLGRVYGVVAVGVVLLIMLIENGRLYGQLVTRQAELRRLSVADPLTAIANRRSFDEALQTEWRRALDGRTTLALLMIDVDCFKAFNDGYGHVAGDHCLRMVAAELSRRVRRSGETIARYGGDEFAILLPRTDRERAVALARHLCESIRNMGLPHAYSTVVRQATITIGVASITMTPQTDAVPAILVEAADRALYAAKEAGRNCVAEEAIDPDVGVGRVLRANWLSAPPNLANP